MYKQALADVGTEWFEEAENAFRQTPDFTEKSSQIRMALTATMRCITRVFVSVTDMTKNLNR